MASSDDLAEQQLFAEIQASAEKVQQYHDPPSVTAVQSANLLNAARLNRRRTVAVAPTSSLSHTSYNVAQSSPARVNGMARTGGAGKLKPVNLWRNDAATQPHRELARRGDPFDLGFSSPEKVAVVPAGKARQKPGRKKRVQDEVSPGLEVPAPHDPPELEDTEKEVPSASSPPYVTDKHHLDEVPETPPTSKRLAGDAGIPRNSMQVPEQRVQVEKRKAADRSPNRGRPSKSPRKDGAGAAEVEAEDMLQARGRSHPPGATHPQVVIPPPEPSTRNTRAAKAKQAQALPPAPAETDQGRDDDGEHPQIDPQQEAYQTLNNQRGHERPDGPPPSAQKPPADGPEVRKPQNPKRRRFRQLRPTNTTNGLDIPSDNEREITQRSKITKRVEQEPATAETEQPRRRKGKKPTSSVSATGPAIISPEEQEQEPQEQEPRRRKGRQPKASKSSANAEITSGQNDGDEEAVRKTRPKSKTTGSVPVASAQGGRAHNDTSRHRHPQTRHDDARNAAEDSLEDLEIDDEEAKSGQAATDVGEHAQSGEEDEEDEADEEEEEEDHDDGQGAGHGAQLSEIDEVLKFLDSEEVSGHCQTEEAKTIKQACQTALEVLADSDTTLDEISITTKHIQILLSKYGAGSDEKKRKKLKVDAYAYLFRQVVTVLESLYDWLSDVCGDIFASLDAMRIVAALVSAMVSVKDKIAEWKAKLHSRYKGESLIKDVDTKLITPLRRLCEIYTTALRNLEDDARKKRAEEEFARERRERQQLELEKQEMEALRIQKLDRWIDLHVCRLRREPDARRRQALRMKREYFDKKMAGSKADETEWREDRDANDVPFSRVDVFMKRVVPPPAAEWTDEHMEALIYGLQTFAGSSVFEKIFEYYCGVGQPLRRFGVPEITAKAADVRLRLLEKYQERGWEEVPEWIEMIPILP
ncbi:uncharacterized protein N0V89_008015 [Didymosphaeria variabile]|uniref:Uncharacterized protein n=1 Tax=Didymosphaeria variabile TaxID=1932322 RepID=A0A9W9C7E9_9PLEO|nr:uncharacterized protein N0V89_008015 [Didymosphaeria variabile]KAJ4349400.1 hypothetical protein N0V89_008015 [Didymosphaeria variabile]